MTPLAQAFVIVALAGHGPGSGWLDKRVVVYRHHAGLMDTAKRMTAREHDDKVIMKAIEDAELGFSRAGGLGRRGYAVSVMVRDLPRWRALVEKLHQNRELAYYTDWQRNPEGFGLILYGTFQRDKGNVLPDE